jgi:hypothetical protein
MAPVLSMPTAPACQERWVFWRKRCAHWKIYFLFEQWKIEPCVLYHLDKLIYSSFFFTFLDSSCLHYFFLFFSFSFPLATILVLRPIAQFIGVSEDSAVRAAAAEAVRPEQFTYNQEANALSQLANGGKTVSVAEKNERAIPN